MIAATVSMLIALAACYVVLCRVDKMVRGVTQPIVYRQHAALGLGLFASALLGFTQWSDWAAAPVSAGALVFLLLSRSRWRKAAPDDTSKPMPLDSGALHHASGGKR